jgi:uncharacterized protein
MSRILFWIALIALVIMAVRSKLRAALKRGETPPQTHRPAAPTHEIESMTRCAHCGVYFPASEAVHADGLDYCSPGHVRLPPR